MSITNTSSKARWASLLQLFCIPAPSPEKRADSESWPKDENLARTSIVCHNPTCQPRPSSAPERTSLQPEPSAAVNNTPEQNGAMLRSKFSVRRKAGGPFAKTLDQVENEPSVEAAPVPSPISPVEPKRCHRRWSSVSMARPGAYTLPEGTLRRSATTVIRVGLLTDGPIKQQTPAPICEPSAPTKPAALAKPHIYNCLRSTEKTLPPRPPTPPFIRVKMDDIPLPPPLPATFKPIPNSSKSPSSVSQWLFYKMDNCELESATDLPYPMAIKAAISKCFSKSPYCHNGSTTTVNTTGLDDGRGILSTWSLHSKEALEGEGFHQRRTLILENKTCSPLSGAALAA